MRHAIASGLFTNLVIVGFSLLAGIVTARYLGSSGRGEVAVALLWPQVLSAILLFGTEVSLARYVGSGKITPIAALRIAGKLVLILGTAGVVAAVLTMPALFAHEKANLVTLAA